MSFRAASEVLVNVLGNTTFQASILALLVLAVQFGFSRLLSASWRYALWLPVVLRLLVPIWPESSLSIFNLFPGPHPKQPKISVEFFDGKLLEHSSRKPISIPKQTFPNLTQASEFHLTPSTWLAMAWMAGFVFLSLRFFYRDRLFRKVLKNAAPLREARLLDLFEECRTMLKVKEKIQLLETGAINSPCLRGGSIVRLLLPKGALSRLNFDEIRHIFLHELAHSKRRDLLVGAVLHFLELLHWFNPLLNLAFRRIRLDRELACDEMVLNVLDANAASAYGETLLKVATEMPDPAFFGQISMFQNKQEIRERCRWIARFRRSKPSRSWLALTLIILLSVTGLSQAVRSSSRPQTRPASVTDPVAAKLLLSVTNGAIHLPGQSKTNSELHTRVYKVHPGTLLKIIDQNTFNSSPRNFASELQKGIRKYFDQVTLGAFSASDSVLHSFSNSDSQSTAPKINQMDGAPLEKSKYRPVKSIFFDFASGELFVRATMDDLALIDAAIGQLNYSSPQILLSAKFTDFIPPSAPIAAILNEVQFESVLEAMKVPGAEILCMPEVSTISGRQVRISMTEPNPTGEEKQEHEDLILDMVPILLPGSKSMLVSVTFKDIKFDRSHKLQTRTIKTDVKLENGETFCGYILEGSSQVTKPSELAKGAELLELRSKITMNEQILAGLRMSYKETHPLVMEAKEQLAALRKNQERYPKNEIVFLTATLVDRYGNRIATPQKVK